ncbi:hypothetical protein BKA70DRAFT_1246890 [Coprinopsis sp. MPI-PUGE-AT-0042]|nr:hypothetical protein BKA70DRAFT_1246890 [Coprinopsis sp. MPI-PUGE-AT-0042]
MTLGEDLEKMTLGGPGRRKQDPVAEAVQKGRLPTVREVKKSVRTMVKTLIQSITTMDDLPRRRYATFKLFYTESTPPDYEPPNFQAGDAEKDKWFLMTHNLDEVPDRFSIGKLNSGFHTVDLKVASVASYLPSKAECDDSVFTGTTNAGVHCAGAPSIGEDASKYKKEVEAHEEDARARNLVWSAEADLDADAEGEDDPGDLVQDTDGVYVSRSELKMAAIAPVGLRNEDGEIEPVPLAAVETPAAQYEGFKEPVMTRLQEINANLTPELGAIEETQALVDTQTDESYTNFFSKAQGPRVASPLPPSNLAMALDSPISSAPSTPSPAENGRVRRRSTRLHYHEPEDEEMLDTETQLAPKAVSQSADSIQSFSVDDQANDKTPTAKAPVKDVGLDCSCGLKGDGQMLFCEAGCGRWYHLWCMGYHSARDERLPNKFMCLDCRLRADLSFQLIKDDIYPMVLDKYRDLVTMRHAIKTFEDSDTISPSEFAKALDGDGNMARQYIQRLEEEEFIEQVTTTLDGFGFETETRVSKARKGKERKAKQRKNVQKIRYAFNKASKRGQKYKDYFNPEQGTESRLLGLDDLRTFRVSTTTLAAVLQTPVDPLSDLPETYEQTLEATLEQASGANLKRASAGPEDEDMDRPMKKVKISVAAGIDLAE